MIRLTTNRYVKAAAAVLLIVMLFICAAGTAGAVAFYDLQHGPYKSLCAQEKTEASDVLRKNIEWQYATLITSYYAGEAADALSDEGDSPAYAALWADGKYAADVSYYYALQSRNLEVQIFDFSDDSVTYDENGTASYSDEASADALYMYDKNPVASFLTAAENDQQLLKSIGAQIDALQLYREIAADTDDEYTSETEAVAVTGTAKSLGSVYGMKVVGVKVFEDGMPQERLQGSLILDSDQLISGDDKSFAEPEATKGYTIAIMHQNGMTAFCTVREPFEYADEYWLVTGFINVFKPLKNALAPAAILSGIAAAVLFAFLMLAAGRRRSAAQKAGDDNGNGSDNENEKPAESFTISPAWPEKIQLDLLFIIIWCIIGAVIGAGALWAAMMLDSDTIRLTEFYTAAAAGIIAAAAAAAAVIGFCMSCAVRLKLGKWWRNTLCWKVCSWASRLVARILKRIFGPAAGACISLIKAAAGSIGVQWKLAAAAAAVLFISVCAGYFGYWEGIWLIAGAILDIIIILAVLAVGIMLRDLKTEGEALASGDLDAKVDTKRMTGAFKAHGENLNSISEGMQIAIDQRMRSERLKTELITNVSHDIKTPLTSIVNYVDLLSREELEERPAEYVEVLKRQSARLKKLTEDLVEASKAATGNINVDLRQLDIRETVNQAAGEYAERLEVAELELIADMPDAPVTAVADGRLLWRVLDNLLSNVCKYSMRGTRVYIAVSDTDPAEAVAGGGHVSISVKNISRDRLNVDVAELLERFVRGDSSRTSSTEGSGLGLNIAKSLTELQGGRFSLSVDGDLFKAEVVLRKDGI